jgi:hypothetical protein
MTADCRRDESSASRAVENALPAGRGLMLAELGSVASQKNSTRLNRPTWRRCERMRWRSTLLTSRFSPHPRTVCQAVWAYRATPWLSGEATGRYGDCVAQDDRSGVRPTITGHRRVESIRSVRNSPRATWNDPRRLFSEPRSARKSALAASQCDAVRSVPFSTWVL